LTAVDPVFVMSQEASMSWETPDYEIIEVCAEASGYLYRR
jgi:hypothetical protein